MQHCPRLAATSLPITGLNHVALPTRRSTLAQQRQGLRRACGSAAPQLRRGSLAIRAAAAAAPLTSDNAPPAPTSAAYTPQLPRKVDGPTAVVTGASQGVGKALALLLARQGYNVVLTARTPAALEAAAAEVVAAAHASSPERVLAVAADVSDEAQVDALVDVVSQRFEGVSVLVNNAGGCVLPLPHLSLGVYCSCRTSAWVQAYSFVRADVQCGVLRGRCQMPTPQAADHRASAALPHPQHGRPPITPLPPFPHQASALPALCWTPPPLRWRASWPQTSRGPCL